MFQILAINFREVMDGLGRLTAVKILVRFSAIYVRKLYGRARGLYFYVNFLIGSGVIIFYVIL